MATSLRPTQPFFYAPSVWARGGYLAEILLVDDETFLHEIYSDFLNLHGHKVVGIALNGEEAVALVRSLPSKPEIVIMDQRMPVKSGVEATKEILTIAPGTRIVFSSADIHSRRAATEAGAIAFVQKPFTLEELLRVLESVLALPPPPPSTEGNPA